MKRRARSIDLAFFIVDRGLPLDSNSENLLPGIQLKKNEISNQDNI
jgi:hypothetical protein